MMPSDIPCQIKFRLLQFKESSWLPLNSFVHSGIHAVHWTRHDVPPQLSDQIFRTSDDLAIIAFQSIGILTGRPGIQSGLIAATVSFSSCLPNCRESTWLFIQADAASRRG
jgi:hypothetical protein